MGRSYFLGLLLLALLSLSFSHGLGRKVMMETQTVEVGDSWVEAEEIEGKAREMMMETLDYNLDPEPNTNPKTGGFVYGPPPRV